MFGKLLFYALLGVILAYAWQIIVFLDLYKRVYNHKPGQCSLVNGPVDGSEDIEYIRSEGIAFITSGIFYMHERPGVTGKMFLYDFKDASNKLVTKELKINGKVENFHPHGMSSWVANGKITLYVISHSSPDFKHSVVVFDYDTTKQELNHVKTIEHNDFIRPNDLFVVGPNQFIFTNDGTAQTTFTNALEMFLALKAGSVGFYDGKDVHWLVDRDYSPNGIWVDLKKKILFVASPNGETIKVYKLGNDYKSADLISTAPLLTSPDNLFMDTNGDLWTAGHPIIKAIAHLDACSSEVHPAPSQVLRLRFSPDYKTHEVTEPYTNDGHQIACSSVAVTNDKDRMLVGTVAGKLLHCEINEHTV